jgi:hypothetical protein
MQTLLALPLPAQPGRVPGVFWRPSLAFLDQLAAFLQGKRVLEIFAGNGYLAGLLAARGIAITATSLRSGHDCHARGLYHPVTALPAAQAVAELGQEHDVLLVCWPTVTPEVLRAATTWGAGRDIVFIGEVTDYSRGHLGGCATDEFFDAIDATHRFNAYQGSPLEQAMVCRLKASQVR